MNEGVEFSGAVLARVRREASGSWGQAFNAFGSSPGNSPNREKVLGILLDSSTPREAALYTLRESRGYNSNFFSVTENAAIEGRLAASRSYFRGALRAFNAILENEAQDNLPGIFFEYPDLINDLGRAFQFACTTRDGIDLFLEWEREIGGRHNADDLRYRLLFFAARIARQRGFVEEALYLFEQALVFAPNSAQINACVWYILDLAIRSDAAFFLSRLESVIPKVRNAAYLDVVLDRFSRELILNRGWGNMLRTFQLIQDLENSLSVSRYAWLIARGIQENFLSAQEMEFAASIINAPAADDLARAYKQIAFNNGDMTLHVRSVMAAYYRSLSAAALGKNFLDLPEATQGRRNRTSAEVEPSPILEFFLGFFKNNAAGFVPRYTRFMEDQLSIEEVRAVAQGLKDAGLYAYAMRLASSYTRREGLAISRQDIEFLYPAAYRDLIERFAKQYDIDKAVFFGLIRQESTFLRAVVSHAGAVGLSQLMPATAEEMANRIRRLGGPDYFSGEGTLNLTDPELNVHIGAFYFNRLMQRFDNDILLALMAYNGGQGRVRRWRAESDLPSDFFMETVPFRETREYSRRVLGAAAIYRALYNL